MILVLTGCTDKKRTSVEVGDGDVSSSGGSSIEASDGSSYDAAGSGSSDDLEASELSEPEEGTTAYELDWNKATFNGVSFYIPSEWTYEEYEDDMVVYKDTQSPDCIFFIYYNDPDISKEARADSVLFGNELIDRGYIRDGVKTTQADVNGPNIVFKARGILYQDDAPYQSLMYYYPVGDYGIVEVLFLHSNDADNKSDRSCLEMTISTLEVDNESVPDDGRDLGIRDLGTLPVTLLDNDELTITVTGVTEDRRSLTLSVVNKTDEELDLSLDAMSVNGYDVVGSWFYGGDEYEFATIFYSVDPNSEEEIRVSAKNLDSYNIKELGRVGIMFSYHGDDYRTRFESDYLLLDAVEDYKEEDYVSYEPSDEVVYQDDKMIITYEGVTDNTACFMVQSLVNVQFDVSGSKVSVDGEYHDNKSTVTVYPGHRCMMPIDEVNVETGMNMMISFSVKDSNGSHYTTESYSVDL